MLFDKLNSVWKWPKSKRQNLKFVRGTNYEEFYSKYEFSVVNNLDKITHYKILGRLHKILYDVFVKKITYCYQSVSYTHLLEKAYSLLSLLIIIHIFLNASAALATESRL